MSTKGQQGSDDRSLLGIIVFLALGAMALFLIMNFVIGPQSREPKHKIRLLRLDCGEANQHGPESRPYDAELRVLVNDRGEKKLYKWRNKVGRQEKAHTWYLDKVIDSDEPISVEFVAIEMGAGSNNHLLGVCKVSASQKLQCVPLGEFILYCQTEQATLPSERCR